MALEPVICPDCGGIHVSKHGNTSDGRQRTICHNDDCSRSTFLHDYLYQAYQPEVKEMIIDMSMNVSGI